MSGDEFNVKHAPTGYGYASGKIYCHNIGLSVAFRQWKAESHCNLIHGYAIQVEFEFLADELDARNWVVDFGSLKSLRGWLEDMFDHKMLVAEDDPCIDVFHMLDQEGLANIRVVPATGCEAMARMIYEYAEQWLKDNGYDGATLGKVTVREHGANWSSYGFQNSAL